MANNKGKKNGKNDNDKSILTFLFISILVTLILNAVIRGNSLTRIEEITYDTFIELVEDGQIESVEVRDDMFIAVRKSETEETEEIEEIEEIEETEETEETEEVVTLDENKQEVLFENPFKTGESAPFFSEERQERVEKVYYHVGRIYHPEIINILLDNDVEVYKPIESGLVLFLQGWVFPILFFYIVIILLTTLMSKKMGGGSGFMSVGKSNAKVHKEAKTGVTFDDVAGQEESKESLKEIVDYLHSPQKYKDIGAKQPKGALLVGPPGTGKTLLAKAVAGEAGVAFISLSGSDFVEMFVGVGASRVRDLFKVAKENAPCIIFIDEIDAIGKSRDSQLGGNDEREQTLNQLLAEMDGFETDKAVVILAATNRPEVLDKALLRPGRFDRRVIVEKPDLKGRISILEVHSKNVKMEDNIDLKKVALATAGGAGADLANIVNESALHAVRNGRTKVAQEDLMEAVEIIIAGKEKKDRIMSEKEKKLVSYHEVGHALASALQKHKDPVQKITIVPRTMGSLGYTMQVPEEEKFLMSKDEMIQEMIILLGGRAAEDLIYSTATTGAHNDIERCTAIARSMVTEYGMSEKFGLMQLESKNSKYLGGSKSLNCSDVTGAIIDEEVRKLIAECYEKAYKYLEDNRELLDKITDFLYEKENITGEEFMNIYNEHFGIVSENEKDEDNQENDENINEVNKVSSENDNITSEE